MARLAVFNNVSLDGYFASKSGDVSWAKGHMDPEFNAFVEENSKPGGTLLLGRVTYDLMKSYWPTPLAMKNDPVVAEHMNKFSKIVFSKSMETASWSNTRLIKGNLEEEIQKLKNGGEDMTILGSGSLVSQLTQAGLIDEFQVVVNPVILSEGRTMFADVKKMLSLKLTKTRTFGNGNVFLAYEPAV